MSDVQATSAGNEKFAPRRSLLLKNGRADPTLSNQFRGPQAGRPSSNDDSRGFVQRLSSSIRLIGSSARLRNASGIRISGERFASASRSFSNVFFFMNRHSAQEHLSVGPGMKIFPGISFRKRWSIPDSITIMNASACESRQYFTIFSVEQTSSANILTAKVHSG